MKNFTDIVSKDKVSGFEAAARQDIAQKQWLDKSFEIALLVLARLKEMHWTQAKLAEEMNVSPQYINKIVKGRENLTLETVALLEQMLGIAIMSIETPMKHRVSAPSALPSLMFSHAGYQQLAKLRPASMDLTYSQKTSKNTKLDTAA